MKITRTLEDALKSKVPVFAREKYLKTFSDDYAWAVSDKFLIPFVIIKKYIFRYSFFTNETIYLASNYNKDEEKLFLENTIGELKKLNIDFICQPPTNVLFNVYPQKSVYARFSTYIIDLTKDEDSIFGNIQSRTGRYIRNAIKEGFEIKKGRKYADIAYNIIKKTQHNQGISFMPEKEFNLLIQSLDDNVEIFVSCKGDNFYSALITPFDNNSAYCLYGGNTENIHNGVNALLHWEAIRHFKNLSVRKFNFVGARINPEEGSKLYGIKKFKEKFGGELTEGYLWKYSINPWKKYLYNFLIFIRTCKKHKDIIDEEKYK